MSDVIYGFKDCPKCGGDRVIVGTAYTNKGAQIVFQCCGRCQRKFLMSGDKFCAELAASAIKKALSRKDKGNGEPE